MAAVSTWSDLLRTRSALCLGLAPSPKWLHAWRMGDDFAGKGRRGLAALAEIRRAADIPVITEVDDPRDVRTVAEVADCLQVDGRHLDNRPLLAELGAQPRPVLLMRGPQAGLDDTSGGVHGNAGQQPGLAPGRALGGAAFLALGRAGGARDHRRGSRLTDDVGGVSTRRRVECVRVQVSEHPPEGPLVGTTNRPSSGSRRAPKRSSTCGEVRAAPTIRDLPEPAEQRRFHQDRIGFQLGFPQDQVGELVKDRVDRGRYRHEHDSYEDLLA
ncbi:hypothetical protein FHR32_007381 [Streptosporangium album]|uniref:DAHP synthetase I/KDSA domain-containing protein n=1 Tax=Streptosporangium album TaxID=47479 RepID=A0A7W7S332_9ACTN|nr:hypothetical protein [Streptosporangium album]MBB4942981.1 hypothetical protein [Streptosporangium album]